MTWPTGTIETTHMDEAGDDPSQARAAIKQTADQVNEIRANGEPLLKTGGTLSGPLNFNSTTYQIEQVSSHLQAKNGKCALLLSGSSGNAHLCANAYFDGTNWVRFDTSKAASLIIAAVDGQYVYTAAAGANPITWSGPFKLRHDNNVFHGRVNSSGVTVRVPTGWSIELFPSGLYIVTHNLGTINYTPMVSLNAGPGTGPYSVQAWDLQANTFRVFTFNSITGNGVTMGFNFSVFID